MRHPSSQSLALISAALVFVNGCGSDPGDGPGPGPTPTIAIGVNPAALSILQGNSAPVVATITRGGGFTGTVTIATEGAPAGVTAAVSNVTTSGTTTTGTVTISVASSVDAAIYNLTIRATGSGVTDATVGFQLTVTRPPSISLTIDPTSSTVIKGGSAAPLVTITRRSFEGAVTFAAEGLPTGVTGTFSASPTTLNTSALTLQVAATTAAGVYPIVIRGTGAGIVAATVPYELRVTEPASYSISTIDPDPKSIAQGGSSSVAVTLARVNFTGSVALTLEDTPAGVTGTFSPSATTGSSTTLTLQTGAGTPTGDHTLKVRGTAVGLPDQTKTFVLRVTGPVQGTYTLSTVPATQAAVQQGGTTNVTINVNRLGGFTGSVVLSAAGTPVGLTATINPSSTTGNTAILALQASGSAALGTIAPPLTIRGTTAGLNDVTLPLTVTVTAPSSGGNVTANFSGCAPGNRPIWVAYQDGTSGPWTRVVGNADSYAFNVTNTKAGVVYVFPTGSNATAVSFTFASRTELQLSNAGLCPTLPATKTLTGTVTNLGSNQLAQISLGGGFGLVAPGQTTFTLNGVESGTFDLIGYARGSTAVLSTDRVLRRVVNTAALGNGASIGSALDFAGSESAAPQSASITIANIAGGENVTHGMFYQTGAGCRPALLYAGMEVGAVSSFTAYGLPAALQQPGETHGLFVSGTTGLSGIRTTLDYFGALGARSVSLPSAMPVFAPSVVAGPYKRLRFQYAQPGDLSSYVFLHYADVGSQRVISLNTTVGGYLGGQAVDLSVPDLSGLSGWDSSWAPAASTTVDWTATGGGLTVSNACAPGGRVTTATRLGTA